MSSEPVSYTHLFNIFIPQIIYPMQVICLHNYILSSILYLLFLFIDDDSDWVLEDVVQKTVVAVQQAHECLENGLTTVSYTHLDVYKRQELYKGC